MNFINGVSFIAICLLLIPVSLFVLGFALYPFVYLWSLYTGKQMPKFIQPIHEMLND